jgi:hypothetical protein
MMKILSPKGALLSVTKVEPLVEKRVSFNGSQLRLCQVAKDNYQLVTGVYLTVSSVDTPFMPANIIVGNLKPAVVNDIMNKLLVEGNYDFSQLSYQKSVPFVDKYKYDEGKSLPYYTEGMLIGGGFPVNDVFSNYSGIAGVFPDDSGVDDDLEDISGMSDEILRANIYELDDTTMPELVAMSREELENKYRSIQAGEC